jgi:ATP-dependent helicase/nuclease subunit A
MTFEQIDGTLSALLSKRYDFAQFLKKYDSAQFTKMIEKEIGIPEFTTPFNPHATQQIAKNIGSPDNATIQLILAGNYELAFLTTTQTLRKKLVGLTRSELYPVLYAQAENFFYEVQRKNADEFIQKNKAFINIANTVLQGYQRIKAKNNQYDFDDLIMKTCEVLTNASDSRYLKDAISLGIKHVFIDEAQDTTPQQWQIVLHIVSLFFERDCTLFVVGDAKQSIFGFQGAKPWMFTTLQEVFERLITQMGGTFQRLELNTSYRSVPEVLSLVDRIFENDSRFLNYACHIPARQDRGFVKCVTVSDADLCPPSKSSEFLYGQNFDNDENVMSATDAIIFKTALIVADLLARQTFCPCVNRNAIPSDVLVLSRKRRNLYKIAGKLFDLGIPCESPQNIVWLDLLAFVTFLIDPHDDYNLACLLKSPFLQDCVVSEEQLSSLCCSRQTVDLEGLRKCSLWSEILKKSDASNSHCPAEEECNFDQDEAANIRNILVEYQTEAANIKNNDDFYNFFHRTLFQVQPYFASYYVTSIFDVFLSEVLSFLSENMPDLAAFLEFIQRCFPQSKFQNEGVQLKTIHGAKGLQSPIVVLTDISIIPREKWIWLDDDDFGAPRGVMLMPSGALARHLREQKLACSNDEEARLLYVAITRAQDGFIIVGRDGDWHSAVKNASS